MNTTEDQAKEVLAPYQEEIQECIVSAWKYYHSYFHDIKHIVSSRSRASIIFDFIVNNVRQKFQGRKNVYISDKKRLFLINFGDKVVLRFKKLRNNKAACIPTQQTLDFFCQVEIPEVPSPKRFIVGYQLNNIQTEIKAISVVYPQSANRNYWAYNLEPIEAKVYDIQPEQIVMDQVVEIGRAHV